MASPEYSIPNFPKISDAEARRAAEAIGWIKPREDVIEKLASVDPSAAINEMRESGLSTGEILRKVGNPGAKQEDLQVPPQINYVRGVREIRYADDKVVRGKLI